MDGVRIGEVLSLGSAMGELERQATSEGMQVVDYLTMLLRRARVPSLTLQEVVTASNLSRGELCKLLGVSRSSVSKWLSGDITRCRAATRYKIRDRLGFDVIFTPMPTNSLSSF